MNLRPLGYEPSELPNCSTPRRTDNITNRRTWGQIGLGAGLAQAGPAFARPGYGLGDVVGAGVAGAPVPDETFASASSARCRAAESFFCASP